MPKKAYKQDFKNYALGWGWVGKEKEKGYGGN
jgi:hypothetical protein